MDIFLHAGEPDKNDIRLRDPTVAGGADLSLAITGEQSIAAAGNLAATFGHPVGLLTQHRAFGPMTGMRYGSFANKPLIDPRRKLTQHRAFGPMTGRRYGSFANKRLSFIAGQWANVLSLESYQPTIELHGQERIAVDSHQPKITLYGQERVTVGQERYTVEVP